MCNPRLTEGERKFPLAPVRAGDTAPPASLCLEPSTGAEPQPWTTAPAQPGRPQQTAAGPAARDWAHQQVRATREVTLMPPCNFHRDTQKRRTPRNTRARETKNGTNLSAHRGVCSCLLPPPPCSCGIKHGQCKLFILSAQHRAGNPCCLRASKFSGAFL